ncbi:hypothetical protein KIN20_011170 [Parelaphostrongylus tenuis]|uniref:SCP domain-containing protein n=1 Tax=Parelaphostrongylus tenuis TaxID=148309 RepID=A0AAD5M902_PARTN|nr:hypothetical protein KIN20_011170 [Parelaphostrongylus tenuis]
MLDLAQSPQSTTSSTTTTTTTSTTTTTTRPSTDCGFSLMSYAYRVTALGMHNNFRSAVATGRMRNGEYPNENAPPSSHMNLLKYDCAAEQHAFNHVRGCSGHGSVPFARPGYSENIHVLRTTATDHLGAIQNAIVTWQNELPGHGIPSNMIFMPSRCPSYMENSNKCCKGLLLMIFGINHEI